MSYALGKAVSMASREGLASVNLGRTKDVGLRLVAEGRYENLSEACRAGLRRLDEDARVVDLLVALGEEGLASGISEDFDIDAFIDEDGEDGARAAA